MDNRQQRRLDALRRLRAHTTLAQNRLGVEREGLRITPAGHLARTLHPHALGAPLTHPHITTDYAEPLLELITPPLPSVEAVLDHLERTHRFVHAQLGDELIWPLSMPCVPERDEDIPLAQYGPSNLGLMKTVYRHGLGLRYGRRMQLIAGVHFNFSMDDPFWRALQSADDDPRPPQCYRSETYLGAVRNLQRLGWLIPYLFGASPAVCANFVDGAAHAELRPLSPDTLYEPHATSLRMGDIGYQNRQECEAGFKAAYDDLPAYIQSLVHAITTPCPHYQALGVREGDRFLQLNPNLLQIENEYYSSVRPKPELHHPLEMPVRALNARGIRYIELRSIDLDPESPLGVQADTLRFLRLLLLHALLDDSPPIGPEEAEAIDKNQSLAAHRGRDPALTLHHPDGPIPLRDWGLAILDRLTPLATLLDHIEGGEAHQHSLQHQRHKLEHPQHTPSARLLHDLHRHQGSLPRLGLERARRHHHQLTTPPLPDADAAPLHAQARASLERQRQIEAQPQIPFDRFLADYYRQLDPLRRP